MKSLMRGIGIWRMKWLRCRRGFVTYKTSLVLVLRLMIVKLGR
uniref:Uncharacterized protein n=1 Tax=Brassica oleracea TaxID=3712 RepID=A0A3P6DT02_BRAOL|nr:unnamed protein product [Brassica oleracea]